MIKVLIGCGDIVEYRDNCLIKILYGTSNFVLYIRFEDLLHELHSWGCDPSNGTLFDMGLLPVYDNLIDCLEMRITAYPQVEIYAVLKIDDPTIQLNGTIKSVFDCKFNWYLSGFEEKLHTLNLGRSEIKLIESFRLQYIRVST